MAGVLAKLGVWSGVGEPSEILRADTPTFNGADLAIAFFNTRSGGDLHDFLRVGPTRFIFGLLDVAGKRETCGAVLEATQACFRSSAKELFAATDVMRWMRWSNYRGASIWRSCAPPEAC